MNAPELALGRPARASVDWRSRLGAWLDDAQTQRVLIALIVLNAVVLGLETSAAVREATGPWLLALDRAILAVFVVEIALRLVVHRLAFFRDPWRVFDFCVIAIALIPASGPLAVLRALRVLRVLRLITLVPSMKRVVGGLLAALPGLGSVVAIIGLIFYVAAVVATGLYSASFPQWFGTLGASAFTLFQIMTLESWAMGIVRPVMEVHPSAWLFFLIFILASTFTLLNLFIAVIVSAIQQEHASAETVAAGGSAGGSVPAVSAAEVAALRREIAGLRAALERTRAGSRRAGRRT